MNKKYKSFNSCQFIKRSQSPSKLQRRKHYIFKEGEKAENKLDDLMDKKFVINGNVRPFVSPFRNSHVEQVCPLITQRSAKKNSIYDFDINKLKKLFRNFTLNKQLAEDIESDNLQIKLCKESYRDLVKNIPNQKFCQFLVYIYCGEVS